MLDTLRAWLNGTRHYNTGVQLFKIVSQDKSLLQELLAGETPANAKRLQESMLKIFANLKPKENATSNVSLPAIATSTKRGTTSIQAKPEQINHDLQLVDKITHTAIAIAKAITNANPELHETCLNHAKLVYKRAMDCRAVLCSMVPSGKYDDVNRPDLVATRQPLALETVRLYNQASQLFDDADFVKVHGHLPKLEPDKVPEDPYANLKDHEVKAALDNLRKNINKIKDREMTPERLELLQKHQHNKSILEDRWHSLKSKT